MDYVIAPQAPAYRVSSTSFATESAFAAHLLELREATRSQFSRLVLIGAEMTADEYRQRERHLRVVSTAETGIAFTPTYCSDVGTLRFLRALPASVRRLSHVLKRALLVHVDLAYDIRRPMNFAVLVLVRLMRRRVMFVVDTDFRLHAKRFRLLGEWGTGRYLVNQYVYIPARSAQIRVAVRVCDLVLLKSQSLVEDFGRGGTHVRSFYDTVHSDEDVISRSDAEARKLRLRDESRPLRLCYFGRLVPYKGVDRMIDAVGIARGEGCAVTLELIGDGPERPALEERVEALGLQAVVRFSPQTSYGPELFARLANADVALAAPLVEDTPRSAFDAFARGLPVIAFDISYFADLARSSGAVVLAKWPDVRSLADAIVEVQGQRGHLSDMVDAAVAFAHEHTQAKWLERRLRWTLDLLPPRN